MFGLWLLLVEIPVVNRHPYLPWIVIAISAVLLALARSWNSAGDLLEAKLLGKIRQRRRDRFDQSQDLMRMSLKYHLRPWRLVTPMVALLLALGFLPADKQPYAVLALILLPAYFLFIDQTVYTLENGVLTTLVGKTKVHEADLREAESFQIQSRIELTKKRPSEFLVIFGAKREPLAELNLSKYGFEEIEEWARTHLRERPQ